MTRDERLAQLRAANPNASDADLQKLLDGQNKAQTQSTVGVALAVGNSIAPFLGPNGLLLMGVANAITSAVMGAMAKGEDVSDADVDKLLDADDAQRAAGQLLRDSVIARQAQAQANSAKPPTA